MAGPDAPEGFTVFDLPDGFIGVNGPLYSRMVDGRFRLGFRVEARHCNPAGIAHGGMLAFFVDMIMPLAAVHEGRVPRTMLPTIRLSQDFLAPAPLGAWVESGANVLRVTKRMFFTECLVTADGAPCVRADGIFKIGPALPPP